jgi:HAD superfamily hydrolase (TIGR01509 family)
MKEAKEYKAIIFDLDGTLIDSLPYHVLAFKDLLLERNIRIDDEYVKKHIGLSTKKILARLKKQYRLKENIKDLYEERRYHYFKFLGRKNIIFPGVKRVLEDLRITYKLAVATGSSEVTFIHSTDKDLQELFDCVVTINDVREGKPYPDELLLAAKRMKVKPSECLVVGDSVFDAIAAKRAKIDFIGVTTGYTSEKQLLKNGAIKVIKSLKELKFLSKIKD